MAHGNFICQFHIYELTELRNHNGKRAVRVKLGGAKGEPFGDATPQANAELLIQNEDVAHDLAQLWRDHLDSGALIGPTFDVRFSPAAVPA